MRVQDGIYFSPNIKYYDVDFNHPNILIEAFKDRVKRYYIEPIKKLNSDYDAFAAGLICVATIDVLSRLKYEIDQVRKRYVSWLVSEIPEFEQKVAEMFYNQFRNGLVHEGRIKNGGQFSYIFGELFTIEEDFLIINPQILVENIENAFNKYIVTVQSHSDEQSNFIRLIERDFGTDIAHAKTK